MTLAVRFAYESRDDAGNWFRCYGNENWEVDERSGGWLPPAATSR